MSKKSSYFLWVILVVVVVGCFTLLLGDFSMRSIGFWAEDKTGIVRLQEETTIPTTGPSVTQDMLGSGTSVDGHTFFELPAGLDRARIHDIIFHEGAMWLGTDMGLVKIVGSEVTIYKQFSEWPFEWSRDLVAIPGGIALQILVAKGNTGGKLKGSHVFHIESEAWQPISGHILAQEWFDGYLYQATSSFDSSKLVRRSPSSSWEEEDVLESVCAGKVSGLEISAIEGELWLTGQAKGTSDCGVLRYNPKTGKRINYKTKDGIQHDQGRDIGGDHAGVYVTHSVKSNSSSFFDFKTERWVSISGSGNSLAVTPQAVWFAAWSPKGPLVKIDRNTLRRTASKPFSESEDEYISTIGVDNKNIWFGTFVETWAGSTYTIKSRLGLYVEKD